MLNSLFRLFGELRQNLRNGVRIAFLLPLREPLRVSAEQIVILVLLDLAVSLLAALAYNGSDGYLNIFALPGVLFPVLLSFLFALMIARLNRQPSLLLTIPIAFLSAGIVMRLFYACLWLAAGLYRKSIYQEQLQSILYYATFVWWLLIAGFFLRRYAASGLGKQISMASAFLRRASYMPLFLLINILPAYMLPHNELWEHHYEPSANNRYAKSINTEEAFHAQAALFKDSLDALQPERPGVGDIYFVGFAGYANEDVFMKELRVIERLLQERFDTTGRSMVLINNPQTAATTPIATATNLAMTLHRLAKVINAEEDMVLLYLTSHGSRQHELSVDFWPLKLNQITPTSLKKMFDDAGIKWRIVVVSACFSGGYIEALKDDRTLIITAADPKQTSFGCGNESDFTYFAKALFDEELRKTYSFADAFEKAKIGILAREKAEKFDPSNPQIFIGEKIAGKLKELEIRLSGLPNAQTAGALPNEK
ncbi:MAG: C13 family peptidase [Burkholderiales bacterium]